MVRIWRTRAGRLGAAAYGVAALLLWPIPLLNVLHAESCAVLALVAFLVAGLSTVRLLEVGMPIGVVVRWQIGILTLPLILMTVPVLWAPNCSYLTGLLLFLTFPAVSALLASSVAFLLHALEVRRKRLLFLLATATVAAATPLYDLGLFPQLYTYNHVFGGVLGPIYDEHLALRPGLFTFRGLSLLWALLFFLSGSVAQTRPGFRHPIVRGALAVSVMLIVAYSFSSSIGWNTTHGVIQESLGEVTVTEHFEVYFDGRSFRAGEMDELTDELEYRYSALSHQLDTRVQDRIRVYLYPTESLKGYLTGSRSTSVAPVWLRHPQIHILKRRAAGSLDHELVHVFSREFGLPGIRASVSVGLVEGLASALEAPDGRPSPSELMAAVIQEGSWDSVSVVEDLTSSLGAFGFWTGRGAVSYAATGSFIRYLLDEYGVESLKKAYPFARFRSAYGKPPEELAGDWYEAVRNSPPVSPEALPMAEIRFAVPSLFETECPHSVPDFVDDYRQGMDRLALLDTLGAVEVLEQSLTKNPEYLPAIARLSLIRLRRGDFRAVLESAAEDTSAMRYPQIMVAVGDAYAMAGRPELARRLYERVQKMVPGYATEVGLVLWLRHRLAADSLSARWFFADKWGSTPPDNLRDDAANALYRSARALARGRSDDVCRALLDWGDSSGVLFSPDDERRFEAQVLLWKAEACSAAGDLEAAVASGEHAARGFLSEDLVDLARYARDRVAFARWKQSQTGMRTSSAAADISPDSPGL